MKLLKKTVFRNKEQNSILKQLAVQIKVRKAATKLQNVWPSAGSLSRRYVTQNLSAHKRYVLTAP